MYVSYLVTMRAMEDSIIIRIASINDAETIRNIYNHEVLNSTASFDLVERSVEEQRIWLSERSGAFSVLVAEIENKVMGFASLSPFNKKDGYRTTVENSIYVDPAARGLGIGSRLLDELLLVATRSGFHAVMARIGGGNDTSITLHEKHGFFLVGVEREVGRKFGRWQDVVVMQKILSAESSD
jgi:L-amino acid N-acyltransferase YncA|tara:strand:+ start:110 stop:658 length:549 start_codon:yes stop_codon:yes gene_type:complete